MNLFFQNSNADELLNKIGVFNNVVIYVNLEKKMQKLCEIAKKIPRIMELREMNPILKADFIQTLPNLLKEIKNLDLKSISQEILETSYDLPQKEQGLKLESLRRECWKAYYLIDNQIKRQKIKIEPKLI